jgi:uncharacterized protein (DUF983 family)
LDVSSAHVGSQILGVIVTLERTIRGRNVSANLLLIIVLITLNSLALLSFLKGFLFAYRPLHRFVESKMESSPWEKQFILPLD